ncbi:MAG: glycoside hydrolase family 16 protein [Paludibacteraceae bacterium]|nr:glycoside hydrolase family 16 protein [Paludibacteraceae bacterium]
MKKFCFTLLSVLVSTLLHAQVKVDDFEDGAGRGWGSVSCGFDIRQNEQKTGINLSNNVLYAMRAPGCDNWSGAILDPYVQKGYKYLHAYMYRNNQNKPNLKVSDTNAQDLEPMTTIVANQWQDVVWDISAYETSGTEFIFFMVDRTDITADAWMLVDEVLFSNDPTPRTAVVGGGTTPVVTPTGEYRLVWSDEFNGTQIDRDIWNIEVNGNGGGNNELQYYCEKGVSVADGCLVLTATKESYSGKTCTSGRVNTQGKVYFTYGKVEARIKMPSTANGLWPAFWMMGNDITSADWPACGETDIVEMGNVNGINRGTQDRYFNGAFHWGTRWDDHRQYAQDYTASYSVQDGEFHIFTCIWTADEIAMYLDNATNPYCRMSIPKTTSDKTAPGYYFHKPNHILLNLAVGGNFPSIWDINGITALAAGPRSMYIDYVRVYQKGDTGETLVGKSGVNQGTALERVEENNAPKARKVMLNGEIRIVRDGKIYTLTGQRIK